MKMLELRGDIVHLPLAEWNEFQLQLARYQHIVNLAASFLSEEQVSEMANCYSVGTALKEALNEL